MSQIFHWNCKIYDGDIHLFAVIINMTDLLCSTTYCGTLGVSMYHKLYITIIPTEKLPTYMLSFMFFFFLSLLLPSPILSFAFCIISHLPSIFFYLPWKEKSLKAVGLLWEYLTQMRLPFISSGSTFYYPACCHGFKLWLTRGLLRRNIDTYWKISLQSVRGPVDWYPLNMQPQAVPSPSLCLLTRLFLPWTSYFFT